MACRRRCGGTSWSYSWSSNPQGQVTYYNSNSQPTQKTCSKTSSSSSSSHSAGTPKNDKTSGAQNYYEVGLTLHNWYRKRHGAGPMVLVDRLNKAGDAYAYKLACSRTLVHSTGRDYGENLYMSTDMSKSKADHVREACKAWYNEVKLYNYNSPGFSMQTGHFTAMVWKDSKELGIGCAIANGCCVVAGCYKPHPNFQGQFGKNVLPYREVQDTDDEEEELQKELERKKKAAEEKAAKEAAEKKLAEEKQQQKLEEDIQEGIQEITIVDDDEIELPAAIKELFESKVDSKNTVGADGLQDLLNQIIEISFKFDGFDKTISSLLISLITLRSGEKSRITYEQFGSIVSVIGGILDAYTEFDRDDSGTLDPYELKDALGEAGFKISYKTFTVLQSLFGEPNKPGVMSFRGFVLCFVLLSKLHIVQTKKPQGMVEDFSLKDWLEQQIENAS